MKNEIWKDIDEFKGMYQVSNLGRVKSLNYRRTGKESILKYSTNNDGYKTVCLHKDGKQTTRLIHKLVAISFIPNIQNKPQINHIDGNKDNNCVDNLEWCTFKENIIHRDIYIKPKGRSLLTKEEVNTIKEAKQNGKNYKKVWENYCNKISLSGFEKVWYGINWRYK